MLGPVVNPTTTHQAKFSMGTVLGLLAVHGKAGVREFDQSFRDKEVGEFCNRVSMVLDQEVDAAYPVRWIGKVTVKTTDGRELHGRVDEPKGDPGNTLSRPELEAKAIELAEFAGAATAAEMNASMKDIWAICDKARVSDLLPPWSQEV